jgi:hypothetical protein
MINRYSNLTGDFWKGNFFDVGEIDDEDLSGEFSTIEGNYQDESAL